ncbi:Cryptococcal mannosyltransferase 1-domain-containing protein [Balamuthia mandrillaris]
MLPLDNKGHPPNHNRRNNNRSHRTNNSSYTLWRQVGSAKDLKYLALFGQDEIWEIECCCGRYRWLVGCCNFERCTTATLRRCLFPLSLLLGLVLFYLLPALFLPLLGSSSSLASPLPVRPRWGTPMWPPGTTRADQIRLSNSRFFIAINQHSNSQIFPDYLEETIRLVSFLKDLTSEAGAWSASATLQNDDGNEDYGPPTNRTFSSVEAAPIYLSIYESGSRDETPLWLALMGVELENLGVPHRIISEPTEERGLDMHRIEFLAQVRNKALEPLYDGPEGYYDQVLFINDVFFKAEDALRLLIYETDMSCGLDFNYNGDRDHAVFYDSWVSRDIAGNPFIPTDFTLDVEDPISNQRLHQGKAFPVFCCWNGIAAIKAEWFYRGIRFRRGYFQSRLQQDEKNNFLPQAVNLECSASECTLLCLDIWRMAWQEEEEPQQVNNKNDNVADKQIEKKKKEGKRRIAKIVVDPQVRVYYERDKLFEEGIWRRVDLNNDQRLPIDRNITWPKEPPHSWHCAGLENSWYHPDKPPVQVLTIP